jgi:hypothetical protein
MFGAAAARFERRGKHRQAGFWGRQRQNRSAKSAPRENVGFSHGLHRMRTNRVPAAEIVGIATGRRFRLNPAKLPIGEFRHNSLPCGMLPTTVRVPCKPT